MEGSQKTVRDAVSQFNRDEEEQKASEQAKQLGVPYFDIRGKEISTDIISLLSVEDAKKGVVALLKKEKKVLIGSPNPSGEEAKKAMAYLGEHFQVDVALITWNAIKDLLPHFEGLATQDLNQRPDYEISAANQPVSFSELVTHLNNAPLQDILSYLVRIAIDSNSSDIHIEPERDGARVRLRIDGVLHIVGKLTDERFKYILSQIELTSGMKINSNESQEGRFEVKVKDKTISVRVETMPTLYGDDISLRIFNTEANMLDLDQLGLMEYHLKNLKKSVNRPQGMILVVGPTGSGKTSTIYALLNAINKPEIKIITLEDPIEYALSGVTQSQVNEGDNFYERLKAVLREDPDVVMIGEIREKETAQVALHAALTGHVMISTFHANDAATALSLLKEISESNTLLASAINLVIAQRLVRKLCPACKKEHLLAGEEKDFIEQKIKGIPPEIFGNRPIKVFEAVGCDACGGLGYKGRLGIFELLSPSLEFQKAVARPNTTVAEIKEMAKINGMISMEEDGVLKALDGITSISEVMRAVRE